MSTQALENEPAHATELNAENVKLELKDHPSASATVSYLFTLTIVERFGRAFIFWKLDDNYAIGHDDVIQLKAGDRWIKSWNVTGTSGDVDTGHPWERRLSVTYFARNYMGSPDWRRLVTTPDT